MNALWWWIDRWRKSTAYTDMTLEQQGAYRNLLDEASLRGGAIPDDERVLAKACGDVKVWRRVRQVVLSRFDLRADGWHNETLDSVLYQSERRAKNQAAWRARRDNKPDNKPDNAADNNAANKPDSPSPSPSLGDPLKNNGSPTTTPASAGYGAPIIMSQKELLRKQKHCAYVGARLKVPKDLHVDLRDDLGGPNADRDLLAWYAELDEEIERTGESILPDVFKWLRGKFTQWATHAGDEAELDAMVKRLEADVAERKGRHS